MVTLKCSFEMMLQFFIPTEFIQHVVVNSHTPQKVPITLLGPEEKLFLLLTVPYALFFVMLLYYSHLLVDFIAFLFSYRYSFISRT